MWRIPQKNVSTGLVLQAVLQTKFQTQNKQIVCRETSTLDFEH